MDNDQQGIQQMAEKYPGVSPPIEKKPTISMNKWTVALLVAVLFILLSSPWCYKLLNGVSKNYLVISSDDGCPNLKGIIIMTVVFLLIARLILW